jgi:CheY-specific phosphatase CheX
MSDLVKLDDWLKATIDAAREFTSTTLDAALVPGEQGADISRDLTGCFVALIGDERSLQIGLASNAAGCQILAQALFASDEPLSDEDVTDALGEIANVIAGGVKKRMATFQLPLAIGLPIVMDGHLRLSERQQMIAADVRLGQVPVRLLIIGDGDHHPNALAHRPA